MTYQLYDYELDSVVLEEERIVFSFPKGFYMPDEDGQKERFWCTTNTTASSTGAK